MNSTRRMLLAVVSALMFADVVGAAEGPVITFENAVDFQALRTFSVVDGQIGAKKPEINNRLFRQRMADAIRASLAAKGLKEVADRPDITVTYQISDGDYSVVDRRQDIRVPRTNGQEGLIIPGGPSPVLYTEGTLVVDISNASNTLIWRGVYRDRETKSPSLSRNLSVDAGKLLAKYPPKKK